MISLPFFIFFAISSSFQKPSLLIPSILYKITQSMADNEITFDNLPEAVGYLIQEIGEIKKIMSQQKATSPNNNFPIGIDDASRIVGKAKSTICTLVQKRMIPCYKIGKKLYFYENELLEWIATGRKKSLTETRAELEKEMYQGVRYQSKKLKF